MWEDSVARGMSSEGERVRVQTYVTADQLESWREEADELDMGDAEYVRSMVQAGRRSFSLYTDDDGVNSEGSNVAKGGSPDVTPGGDALEVRVLEVLHEEEFADWDELVAGVTDDIEERLDETLEELQAADRIRYSGRQDGYTVVDDDG